MFGTPGDFLKGYLFRSEDVTDCFIVLDSMVNGVHASDRYGVLAESGFDKRIKTSPKESKTLAPQSESIIEPLPIFGREPSSQSFT